MQRLTLTPCFGWVWLRKEAKNRFNGLLHTVETVETVTIGSGLICTQLKQGVNEKILAGAENVRNVQVETVSCKNTIPSPSYQL